MKTLISKLIDIFAYKHPELWHDIKDKLFKIIDLEVEEQRLKMKANVNKLYNKLMKK